MPTTPRDAPLLVIKLGGAAAGDSATRAAFFAGVATLVAAGCRVVLVHGGGPEIDSMLRRLGIPSRRHQGLRVTDAESMEVVEMVLAGRVNKVLVSAAQEHGLRVVGVSGVDGRTVLARRTRDERLGYVGEVERVDPRLLEVLLAGAFVPLFCSIAADETGTHFNINADEFASAIARGMEAATMLLITDVPGILRNFPDRTSLIPSLRLDEAESMLTSEDFSEGMIPKIRACVNAVRGGVKRAWITDGSDPQMWSALIAGRSLHGTRIE